MSDETDSTTLFHRPLESLLNEQSHMTLGSKFTWECYTVYKSLKDCTVLHCDQNPT